LVSFTELTKSMDLCFTPHDVCLQISSYVWELVDGKKGGNIECIESVRGVTMILLTDGFQVNVDQS
jgi:hypothetical protein